jgi:Intracellular proteinase inhibitor
MSPRAALVAFVAFALSAASSLACGPRSRTTEPATTKRVAGGPPVVSSLDVQLTDAVRFAFHITNHAAKRLELTFPDGLTHDVRVVDESGNEVWRWSEGRMYTQTLQNHILDADETLSYRADWRPETLHGTFTAVASLRSHNYPIEQRVRFTLP